MKKIIFPIFLLVSFISPLLLHAENKVLFQMLQNVGNHGDRVDVIGYIDNQGKIKISLPSNDKVSFTFSQWTRPYFLEDLELLYSNGPVYINRKGEIVLRPNVVIAHNFFDGLAMVWNGGKYKDPNLDEFYGYGFMDKTGKIVIPEIFDKANDFHEGLAAVGVWDDKVKKQYGWVQIGDRYSFSGLLDKYGFINSEGKFVIQPQYRFAHDFHEGLAAVFLDYNYGYIDKDGAVVIPFRHVDASNGINDFHEGLAAITIKDKYGFMDKTGKIVIPPQFDLPWDDDIHDFHENMAVVCIHKNSKQYYGVIDKTGKYLIKPRYKFIGDYSEGLASIKIGRKYGYINKYGKLVIKPQFDSARDFINGIAAISGNSISGYIDPTGKIVWHSLPAKDFKKN